MRTKSNKESTLYVYHNNRSTGVIDEGLNLLGHLELATLGHVQQVEHGETVCVLI